MEQDLGLFKFLFHLFYPLDILEKKKIKNKKKKIIFISFILSPLERGVPPSRGGT